MAELRHHRNGGSTSIPWSTSQDSQLSFIARGLLGYALSLPPGWAFSAERIANETPNEGKRAVLNGLKELEATGYRRVVTERGPNGQLKTIVEFAFMPVPEWITEFERKKSTQAARKQPGPKPLTAGAKKAAQESANAAREAKLGKRTKPQVAPEVNQPESGNTDSGQAGETNKTAGRTGSQPTGIRPVELLRSTPTERDTHTPVPPVTDSSSAGDVDGVCVSNEAEDLTRHVLVASVPETPRGRLTSIDRLRLAQLVDACLRCGHDAATIQRRVRGLCNEGTLAPMTHLTRALSALEAEAPASRGTSAPQSSTGVSAASGAPRASVHRADCVAGQITCSADCSATCNGQHEPIGPACPTCQPTQTVSKRRPKAKPASQTPKRATPRQRHTETDDEIERARQLKALAAFEKQFGGIS